jgi:hypothetical protein
MVILRRPQLQYAIPQPDPTLDRWRIRNVRAQYPVEMIGSSRPLAVVFTEPSGVQTPEHSEIRPWQGRIEHPYASVEVTCCRLNGRELGPKQRGLLRKDAHSQLAKGPREPSRTEPSKSVGRNQEDRAR